MTRVCLSVLIDADFIAELDDSMDVFVVGRCC